MAKEKKLSKRNQKQIKSIEGRLKDPSLTAGEEMCLSYTLRDLKEGKHIPWHLL